ncbi:MAG: pilus assembly PilX N-terminal domain-containing protein [Candidatus Taylorbacteria bacterium]
MRTKKYLISHASSGHRGDILITALILAAVTLTVTVGLVNWGATMLAQIRNVKAREQAFQIAEAGIDYYRWHLAQYPTDYRDGTTESGPYIHEFYDKDGNIIGSYSLTITPPLTGSTIVTIVSKGTASSTPPTVRTIQARMAIPSFAKFAVVANDNMNFGSGTTVYGPIQSNKGIHFDGVAHNLVSSALQKYTDPDSSSCTTSNSWGVHTCVPGPGYPAGDPASPTASPLRSDVFLAGRSYPVPAIDFTGLTVGLTQLQTSAQDSGKEWTASGKNGYHIVLKVTNGVTSYDMYKVTAVQETPPNCGTDGTAQSQLSGPQYYQWGTWSIKYTVAGNSYSETRMAGTNADGSWPIPANGIIFVDDHVWVNGTISNARMVIVAGIIGSTDPTKYGNIIVNDDLMYTNHDGTDVIGLIAQGNVNVGMMSDNSLEINAALVAENGRVGRFYYNANCKFNNVDYSRRSSLTLNGMIATNVRYGFAYSDNTGYGIRNINYNSDLLYSPPPSFPQATTQYELMSWKEI